MSGGKRYFTPQGGPPNKRKSQQPYFVDKRLTPRVNEYLNSYGQENKSDVDGIIDYLQMSFPEYGRKKRLSLRQSVVKVLSSSPKPTPDKKVKLQKQLQDGDRASDNSSFSSEEEELIEAKNTNMINNSMHNLYARVNKDLMSKSICEDSVKVDGENEITNALVTEQARKVVNSSIAESQNEILDKVKSYDMSTPVPSPGGSKSGKSDDERSKRNQSKRRRNRENENGKVASGKHSIKPTESTLKLSDVGGYENALEEVMKLLFHLKHPEVFQRLGVKPPRGFLLHGPPGCGKTLLANAIAGELQLPYFKLAATEVISGVSGESEEKLRELFVAAQQASPSIIFIDEIDAIAPNRESASKEMERRIVSQLLVCMDDLDGGDSDVLLIGATNRPDSLDPALRRAGRFDREICLGIPDHAARKRIFGVVCGGLRLADNFDYDEIASLTPGFVGADLVSLMREAAMFAVQRIFQNIEEKTAASQLTEESQNSEETPIEESIKGNETAAPEAKFKALSWVKDRPPLPTEELDRFFIEMEDFKQALTTVQPSAKREGFATVPDVTWKDIGALEDIRDELSLAILAPVRHYEQFKSLGIANPPGILLAGPPGCGKTLLAKAIANEAGINFISVKGPELLNMYVGESERAVRQVFQRARNSAPCVIFFDEIDALCPKRSEMGESSASSRVVNQLLTEMDGLVVRKQVFLMGATNRPDIIDPAILRPGRLDKILFVGLPEPEDRVKILRTVTKFGTQPRLAEDVDLEQISRDARCERYSGADLAALVREASVQILKDFMRNDAQIEHGNTGLVVTMQHFEQAFTKLRPSVSLESKNWYDKLRAKFGIQ